MISTAYRSTTTTRATMFLIFVAAAVLSAGRPASAAGEESDGKMVEEGVEGLWAAMDPPAGYAWPPPVHKLDLDDIQAACGNAAKPGERVEPHVIVCRGVMEKI